MGYSPIRTPLMSVPPPLLFLSPLLSSLTAGASAANLNLMTHTLAAVKKCRWLCGKKKGKREAGANHDLCQPVMKFVNI